MKLEHLIQGYNFNRIPAKIKEVVSLNAGVITYTKDEDINASYLVNEEGFVNALILFSNCIVRTNKNLDNQLKHTTNTLIIIQKTIELLGNTKQTEANKILISLGMFGKIIKRKAVKFMDYVYEVDVVDGVLKFSVINKEVQSIVGATKSPPLKSRK